MDVYVSTLGVCVYFGKHCPQFCLRCPTWDRQVTALLPGWERSCLEHHRAAGPSPTSRDPQTWALLLPGASCDLAQSILRSGCLGLSCSSNQKVTLWSWASPSPFWITLLYLLYGIWVFPQLRILRGHQTSSGYKTTCLCIIPRRRSRVMLSSLRQPTIPVCQGPWGFPEQETITAKIRRILSKLG